MKKQRGKLSGVKKKNIDSIKIVKISKIINFKKNSIKVLMKKARIFRSHKQNQWKFSSSNKKIKVEKERILINLE